MSKLCMGFLAAVALCGCGLDGLQGIGKTISGSGKQKSEVRTVGKFDHVALEGSVDCDISVGPKQSLSITTDDNLLSTVTTEVKDGVLTISQKGSTSSRIGCKVKITVPSLAGYDVSGSGDAAISGIKIGRFVVSLAGSGDVFATGTADDLEISLSGSGDINFKGVASKSAKVSISGSGDVNVRASSSLEASIAGSGDITVFGNPKISKSIVGSGEIRNGE